ncbi:nitrogen permease regulator of amino acid transport activity 3-domain-containing protein [Pyronema omphalodes]|nr:nitrogen permease regulator of amino acid transport activity 3-domain-containing protein [Pyronema omphalodes]
MTSTNNQYHHPKYISRTNTQLTTLTPNSCLLAVLLVTRSSSGPTLTFHYPPRPRIESPQTRIIRSQSPSDSSSSSSSSEDDDADETSRTTATQQPGAASDAESRKTRFRRRDDSDADRVEPKKPRSAETVLGFKTEFLADMLAPKAAAARGRFEMSVDDIVFIGMPVHVRPDGTWRRSRKRKKKENEGYAPEQEEERSGVEKVEKGVKDLSVEDTGKVGEKEATEAADHDADDEREGETPTEQASTESSMNMFHVVFVLNPPELEYQARTSQIYDYVVRRFSRTLKYEQDKDGYVWKEAEKIARLKEQAAHEDISYSELWRKIIDNSNLAHAISRIYIDISQNKIAHIFLNNHRTLSVQIPIVTEINRLPTLMDQPMPGLPLTTANSFGDEETEGDAILAKHFTLLFLEEVETIIKDIVAEPTESSASLVHFVKNVKPTQSFVQISVQSGIALHEIQVLARHLIQWRKARPIPPIHQRNTYIVSPNADMKRVPQLIPVYSKTFPTMPGLEKMLGMLSGPPRSFASFIPSKDHRGTYLEILAWLIRHSLVTELRTFAWIKIPRHIKQSVHEERLKQREENPESPTPDDDEDERLDEDSFILDPSKASGIESAWLEMACREQSSDVKALFERMLKYLNGQHALEKIAVREGIPRKEVRKVFSVMEKIIVYAKHW